MIVHCLTVLPAMSLHSAQITLLRRSPSASTGRMLTRFLVRLSHSNLTVPSTMREERVVAADADVAGRD